MRSIAFALDPDNYWVEIISQNPVSETEGKKSDVSTYRMNHTMIRVKDAEKSLNFYQQVMGMTLQRTSEQKEAGFTLYFLSYGPKAPEQSANGVNPIADREGILELTWNHGSENDDSVKYHNGNDEPQGCMSSTLDPVLKSNLILTCVKSATPASLSMTWTLPASVSKT